MNSVAPQSTLDPRIAALGRDYLDQQVDIPSLKPQQLLIPDVGSVALMRVGGISSYRDYRGAPILPSQQQMEDLTTGLFGAQSPFIYLLTGEETQIGLYVGTATYRNVHVEAQQTATSADTLAALAGALRGAYPGIILQGQRDDVFKQIQQKVQALPFAGAIIGTPTLADGNSESPCDQIERLIRGLYRHRWAYLVIACPAERKETAALYANTLQVLDHLAYRASAGKLKLPTDQSYEEYLGRVSAKLDLGKAQGLWHTAAYLLCGDAATYNRARTIVASLYSGDGSRPDRVRVLACHRLIPAIQQFALPIAPAPQIQDIVGYPFAYASLCTSRELAGFTQLPTEEMPGYQILQEARFDVAVTACPPDALVIGQVTDRGRAMGYDYHIAPSHLTRHTLIAGITGSGKTNTMLYLLNQAKQQGIPFLVIEPAKTEYRKQLHSELGGDLEIFTLGDETVAPFRINPFHVIRGVPIQTHIDHLTAVFNASFVMYAPMPHVLERCIHEVYEDRGWDLVNNTNERGIHSQAYPTLTDLYRKVDPVVNSLGYDPKITMDVKAALKTRINSLRIGGKGLMLDTRSSIPMSILLQRPTILELDRIGDDDEKAFLIGLLLTLLYEYRVAEGIQTTEKLQHLTIVEEAHRLLKHVPLTANADVANTRGKAVETFCNMLAEVRAYGEGFIVIEQIPTKLAADVIKNTGLKIVHRLASDDDRRAIGATMNLDENQHRRLASLSAGQAAVFGPYDDGALLVGVPFSKSKSASPAINREQEDQQIHQKMQHFAANRQGLYLPPGYPLIEPNIASRYRWEALQMVEIPELQESIARYVLSTVLQAPALIEEFSALFNAVARLRMHGQAKDGSMTVVGYGIEDYFDRRGHQYGWNYARLNEAKGLFLALLRDIVVVRSQQGVLLHSLTADELLKIQAFQKSYRELCHMPAYPYANCQQICADRLCLYRHAVAPQVNNAELDKQFNEVVATKLPSGQSHDPMWIALSAICSGAPVRQAVTTMVPLKERRRAALCFGLQKTEALPDLDTAQRETIARSLIAVVHDQLK